MKMRNKFLALLLAVSMSFSVSACGSSADNQGEGKPATEDTAKDQEETTDVYAAALEKMKEISSLNGKMNVEMDLNVEAAGQKQTMQTVTTMDMSCLYNPTRIKMDMDMDAGEGTKINMSVYAEMTDDGKYNMYMYDGANWQTQTVEAADIQQYDAAGNMTGYMQESYNFQDAGTEQIDGKDARKYTGVMTGDDMRAAILSTGTLNSLSSLGIDDSQVETMLKDLGELPITLWIDETDLYPVKYEMDMSNLLNSLMKGIMESAGEDAEGVSLEYTKAKIEMTCSDFNAVSEFSIPEEAKAAAPAA